MNTQGLLSIVALGSAALLAACATTPQPSRPIETLLAERGYQRGERVSSIPDFVIDDWSYVDDQHLMFTKGVRRNYLITLAPACPPGLEHALAIGFTSTTGSVTTFDDVIYDDTGMPYRCRITDLHRLTPLPQDEASDAS